MKPAVLAIALAALLASVICSPGQEAPPSATKSQGISSGLDLVVVDPSGAVVPRAKVIIADGAKELLANGLTDRRGKFSVSQVPPGAYQVTVRLAGFKTLTVTAKVQPHQISELNLVLTVDPVPDSFHHGELRLELVVRDENAAVIPTASIVITQEETGATFNGSTNPEGAYRALGLAAGNYTVNVGHPGFKTHVTNITLREHEAHTVTITLVVG